LLGIDGPMVLSVSRLAPQKNLGLLLDAWQQLVEDDTLTCAVLTGAEGNFSSGMDLRAMAGDVDPDGAIDEQARIEAESCFKIIEKYADSKDEVFRQRAIQIKEQRADLAKHHLDVLWSDWYKPEKHDQKFPQLKDTLKQAVSQGSKVKASMDKAEAQKWLDLIDQVDKIWQQAGGPQETRVARATAAPTRA